ncbi:glycosyl transferase [Gallibacterium anatis 10672-6]|uniref:glycosyltransferase family 25 protein n=1 Tax=Gallibacterium anatis TaxID=750 RepID=UPI000530E028|nr:glycosyltransferase family 25 protein [Gallibacterium anatis]KGQ52452.1 glycosyl transferase [Gallibacterium anatis 10672-6]
MLPIYVIHIDSATERADSIRQQFDNLKIEFEFFPAINAKKTPNHPLFSHYNAKKHFQRKGRNLSLGELGCYASHYSTWKKCLELNQPIIVLEDDVTILENFKDIYTNAERIIQKYDFVWLHKNHRSDDKVIVESIDAFSIAKFYRDYFCAQGYLITPKSAKQLLTYCEEWIYPVDDQMGRFYENKIENYAIYPACIDHIASMESLIGDDRRGKKKLSFTSKIRREYFNLKDHCRRAWHNFCFKLTH